MAPNRSVALAFCAVLGFASGSLVLISGSAAQTPAREVLLGVARIGAVPDQHQDADQQFQYARALIADGKMAAGQRLLEQVVARYPDSDAAMHARRDLADVYVALKARPMMPAAGQVTYLGGAPSASPSVASGWRTIVRPATSSLLTAQDSLRTTAGDLVFFSEGSADLGARARKALAAQAAWLMQNPDQSVTVEGHADESGSAPELIALSDARATAVRARLIEEGVAPDRIRTAAFGIDRRVAICADDSCASQNRRAVTVVGAATVARSPVR